MQEELDIYCFHVESTTTFSQAHTLLLLERERKFNFVSAYDHALLRPQAQTALPSIF